MAARKKTIARASEDRAAFASATDASAIAGLAIDPANTQYMMFAQRTGPVTWAVPSGAIYWRSDFRDMMDAKTLYWSLYDDVLVRDGQCEAVFRKRVRAVTSMPITIIPARGGSATIAQRKRAENTQAAFYGIRNISRSLSLLAETWLLKGFAPTQIVPAPRGGALRIAIDELAYLDPNWIFFTTDGHMHLRDAPGAYVGRDLTAERPGQFFAPALSPRPLNPYSIGLGENLLRPFWLTTMGGVKAWAIGCERLAIPIRDVSIPAKWTTNSGVKTQTKTDVMALNRDSVFVHDEEIKLTLLAANAAGMAETFDKFVRFCDEYKSKIILSEVLTTDTSMRGSSEIAMGHREVRKEVRDADAAALAEWLTEHVVGWYETVNDGVDDPGDWSQVVIGDPVGAPQGPALFGAIALLRAAQGAGVPVTVEQWQRLGVEPPQPGETVLPMIPAPGGFGAGVAGGGGGGMNGGMPGGMSGEGHTAFAADGAAGDRAALLDGALGPLAREYRAMIEAATGDLPGKV